MYSTNKRNIEDILVWAKIVCLFFWCDKLSCCFCFAALLNNFTMSRIIARNLLASRFTQGNSRYFQKFPLCFKTNHSNLVQVSHDLIPMSRPLMSHQIHRLTRKIKIAWLALGWKSSNRSYAKKHPLVNWTRAKGDIHIKRKSLYKHGQMMSTHIRARLVNFRFIAFRPHICVN